MLATVQELALLREINRRYTYGTAPVTRTHRSPAPLAAEQPDAILHVSESPGHNIGHDRSDELTSVIVPCAG